MFCARLESFTDINLKMKESYQQAQQFLDDIFRFARLDLHAEAGEGEGGCTLNIDGEDSLLRARRHARSLVPSSVQQFGDLIQ